MLGLILPSAALAQSSAAQLVRFTVFSARPIADLTFVPRPNAEPRAIVFYPTARSPRYEYRGAMPLRFVDSQSGDVVAEAAIPAAMADALLLFLPPEKPNDSGTLKYRIAVLDDGAARHGPGGLGIINLSGLALTATVNGTAVGVKPGLNPTIQAGRSARVVLRTEFKGQPYQSYAGTIALGANQRALLILFPPYYQGSLEVQSRLLIDAPGAVSPVRR